MFQKSAPNPYLINVVKNYWNIDLSIPADENYKDSMKVAGLQQLIFFYGNFDKKKIINHSLIETDFNVIGQATHLHPYSMQGNIKVFGVQFTPTGFYKLFGIPMFDLIDKGYDLSSVIGLEGKQIREQLGNTNSFNQRVIIIEKFLMAKLLSSRYTTNLTDYAIEFISESNGTLIIPDIADKLNITAKTLGRHFEEKVGLQPKFFSRILKFTNMLNELHFLSRSNAKDLMDKYNYFDQSHLIKDFIVMTGKTPNQYFKDAIQLDNFFLQK